MRRGRLAGILAGGAALAAGLVALGQTQKPILHEYVPPPASGDGRSTILDPSAPPGRAFDQDPRPATNPVAIKNGPDILPRPPGDKAPSADEQLYGLGARGSAIDRVTEYEPDRQVGADGTLYYNEVFNPSVVPFKRMSTLDRVDHDGDYRMGIHDPFRVPLPVGGETEPHRDLFWGSLVVVLRTGEDVALPSVAPDMRILSYEAEPAVDLVFSKDGADNFYVRTDDPRVAGPVRLVFLADASSRYFAPVVPKGYRIRDATRSGHLRPLAPRAQRVAESLFRTVGVSPDQPLDVAVDRLVRYFRSFEAGEGLPRSGDTYRDLTTSQLGVCRHRSFAFVTTAQALGIPARYVFNEAHAWVEIWVPESHWIRVDLGGAALELDVSNASDKTMYRPRGEDPFPQPPEYSDNYTQLRGDIRGLRPEQIEAGRKARDPDGSSPSGDPGDPDGPAPGLPEAAVDPDDQRPRTSLRIATVDATGYRGEAIRVSGRIQAGGEGASGLRVQIYLAPQGAGPGAARLVGETVSGPDGAFTAVVSLPANLPLGRHEVYAATPGDSRRAPGLSR